MATLISALSGKVNILKNGRTESELGKRVFLARERKENVFLERERGFHGKGCCVGVYFVEL